MAGGRLRLRWATWWPAPYWIPRFTHLAARPEVDFEAVFLTASPPHHGWRLDRRSWHFPHVVVRETARISGYGSPSRRPENLIPLVRGAGVKLIMPYAHPTFVAAAVTARARRMPYYLFVANTAADDRSRTRSSEILKRVMFSGASGLLATGPWQARYAQIYAPVARRIAMIGNPVETAELRPRAERLLPQRNELRERRGWRERFVIAYVGRFSFLEGRDLHEAYAAADVFALPSTSEAWGLVVNEAMEFGLPIVASVAIGSRHLIEEGRTGFTFDPADLPALVQILGLLASDQELRLRIGESARERIATETIDAWAEQVLAAVD
jgi:glycosyltransferase involved in cell wall biosynthesis